jgi:hypothetical protein
MPKVDVLIQATDEASATINGVNKSITGTETATKAATFSVTDFYSAMGIAEKALGYAKGAYDQTAGAAMDYAQTVRDLSNISGQSAEETSTFIQVLDDYRLTADDATIATKALTKNGHAPSIETLGKLSDEYLKLNSTEEKNAFILKNLGKGGLEWAQVLQQGSAALKEQSGLVEKGLILTQKQLDAAEKLRLAQDQLNDSVDGLKVTFGNELIPVVLDVTNSYNDNIRAVELAKEAGMGLLAYVGSPFIQSYKQQAIAEREAAEATKQSATAMDGASISAADLAQQQKDLEAAIKATTEANTGQLSLILKIQSENDNYADAVGKLNIKQQELATALDAARVEFGDNSVEVAKATDALNANGKAIQDLADKHAEAMKRIAWDLLVTKLQADGFTDAEFKIALQAGETAGVLDAETVKMATAMNNTANAAAGVVVQTDAITTSVNNIPTEKTVTVTVTTLSNGSTSVSGNENVAGAGGSEAYTPTVKPWTGFNESGIYGSWTTPRLGTGDNSDQYNGMGWWNGHASGGMFTIPSSYGSEGFRLGSGDRASGGEKLAIAPQGKDFIDYDRLARATALAVRDALLMIGR